MKPEAPRRILRSRILSSTLVLAALLSSHACMKSDCADTESCGSFTPASGCGWRIDDDTIAYSTDDLEARDATWSEDQGWTLPNGRHPVFTCDLPAAPDDDGGMNGTGGSSGGGSGASGSGNGGNTGNSGSGNSGNGGANGGTPGNGGNGGNGPGPDGGDPGVVCGDTWVTGCVPSQQNGVFVDASAADGGEGSLASPFNSIVDALAAARDGNATDVYICAGNYDERVVVTDSEAGIDLHGGFNCNGFGYDGSVPVVSRSNGGYALYIDALQSPILIEDLAFTAVDATNPGESSIAAFVSASSSVTFDRCQFTAGTGEDGADGVTEDFVEGVGEGFWRMSTELDGAPGTGGEGGGMTGPFTCPAGDITFGGAGGDPLPQNGNDGGPIGRGGNGGSGINCGSFGSGASGDPGPAGPDGPAGALGGVIDPSGFVPNAGGDGEVGEVGGGGGGGTGYNGSGNEDGGGGGGGAGGCGGNFGPGGQGGGASVALLVFDSILILRESQMTSASAGNGGDGDSGQVGQSGGSFANGNPLGCPGGAGAAGGDGGGGGAGAGGISVGLLWTGDTDPVLDQATTDAITVGTEGAAGTGGGVDNDGADGIAEATYEL